MYMCNGLEFHFKQTVKGLVNGIGVLHAYRRTHTNSTSSRRIMAAEYAKARKHLVEAAAKDKTGKLSNEWYTQNATLYDQNKNYYRFHEECVNVFKQKVDRKDCSIIDIAVGTGCMGELLRDAGYTGYIDGVDRNTAMTEIAKAKNIYRNIWNTNIGPDKIEMIADGTYDHGTAGSCIGRGQIEFTWLPTLLRTIKPGGYLVWTLPRFKTDFDVSTLETLKKHCEQWEREDICHLDLCVGAMHTIDEDGYVIVLQRGSKEI